MFAFWVGFWKRIILISAQQTVTDSHNSMGVIMDRFVTAFFGKGKVGERKKLSPQKADLCQACLAQTCLLLFPVQACLV